MDYETRHEMIDILCTLPDIPESIKPRLLALKERTHADILDEFKNIIEVCDRDKLLKTFEDVIIKGMWKEISGSEWSSQLL